MPAEASLFAVWKNGGMDDIVRVQQYIDRARDFFMAMQLVRDDLLYANSAALLAVHSAISYSDALRVGLGDGGLQGEDHNSDARSLVRLLHERGGIDESGVKHLKYLVSQKSMIAYSGRENWTRVKFGNLPRRQNDLPVGSIQLEEGLA